MIRAVFRSKSGLLCGFTLEGHAGAGRKGGDIVCAAVSSAAFMAANTVTDVCRCEAETEIRDGFLRLDVKAPTRSREILEGFRLHLEQLRQQYPNRIQVDFMEVSSC